MGPFEMLESIGLDNFFSKMGKAELNPFLVNLKNKATKKFYDDRQKYTNIETLGKIKKTVTKIDKNDSAEIFRFKDFNIVEFNTKANALDYNSMDALKKATDKPLIIINESMQFSAGVNLNYVMEFVNKGDMKSVEKFIKYFQETCKHLKYCENPVISAPSGLALGGGEEVLLQSNYVVSHTNIVMGLVETIVGLVPAGGGCKELLWRWTQTNESKKDPEFASLKVFDIIGYAKTATSPQEAKPLLFLDSNHEVIINRNNLFSVARNFIEKNKEFSPPIECKFKLSGSQVRQKMQKILDDLYNSKKIMDHGMVVGKELAYVLSGGDTEKNKEITEDQMYNLELNSFMKLLETKNTQSRITHTLKTGKPLIN
jgi:3-hydroxyacyl-CoA dehydrogenase